MNTYKRQTSTMQNSEPLEQDIPMIDYTNFVMRHFKEDFKGTNLSKFDKGDLLDLINNAYDELFMIDVNPESTTEVELLDSLYPFCKYLVIPIEGVLDIPCKTKCIEPADYQFIEWDYSSRTPDELAVATRWLNLPKMFPRPKSKYLIAILYTREQLESEHLAQETEPDVTPVTFELHEDTEYGIVSLMGTIEPYPDPLVPITMMRNALGKEYGGNGTPIDRAEYDKSVEFWRHHILVK